MIAAKNSMKPSVKIFRVPVLSFNALEYTDMIKGGELQITSLPMLNNVNGNELEDLVRSELRVIMEFPDYSFHTQAVEQCDKIVIEVSMTLCGEKT